MRNQYRMYQRNGRNFYAKDARTGQTFSLATADRREAARLLLAKNQAAEQPYLNVAMAKVYLSAQSPELLTRTWGAVLEQITQSYQGPTATRWRKFAASSPIRMLVNLPLYLTEAAHFLAVLDHKKAGVSTNVWLRVLHNRALDLGWLLKPVLNKRLWPKIQYKARRAITAEEHAQILDSENLEDYALFYRLLWETGGSQTDIARLQAENVDWGKNRLHYSRRKLMNRGGGQAALALGVGLKLILRRLPAKGPLFPRLGLLSEDERASHFRKVCLRVKISGITLHSYRYSWAERAYTAGMPEREAQAHLGHGCQAIHRAYAKRAEVVTLPLDHYEQIKAAKLLYFTPETSDGAEKTPNNFANL